MKYRCLSLPKAIVLLAMVAFTGEAKAQLTVNSTFKPFSFEEMLIGPMLATQAFKAAEAKFEEYYVKANSEKRKGNYDMALFYLDRCSRLNAQFKGNLYNQQALDKEVASVKSMMQKNAATSQQKATQTRNYNTGRIRLRNSTEIPLRECESIVSDEVAKIAPNSWVNVLFVSPDEWFMKVEYNGMVGYISKAWLDIK